MISFLQVKEAVAASYSDVLKDAGADEDLASCRKEIMEAKDLSALSDVLGYNGFSPEDGYEYILNCLITPEPAVK